MDPMTGLTAAGHSVSGRLSFYVAIQLASVLLPGAVVLLELSLLVINFVPHQGNDVSYLLGALAKVTGAGTFVLIMVALAASYVVGYLCREAAFSVVAIVERVKQRFAPPQPQHERLRQFLGGETFDALVTAHPLLVPSGASHHVEDHWNPGGHHRGASYVAFIYSKLWLRSHAPHLAIDALEAEINILLATLPPVILFSMDAFFATGLPIVLRILTVPAALAICVAIVRQTVRLRETERWEAIRNLAFDFSMRKAAAELPGSGD